MKRKPLIRFIPFRLALLVAPLLAAWPQFSRAADQQWTGANNGTWHTGTNWSPGGGFPGDSTLNATGEGTTADIMSIAAANSTGNIGLNWGTLGGLSLGAIDINKTNTTGVVIGANATASGVLRLNGATVNSVANTVLRCSGSANLTINRTNITTNPGIISSIELGLASSVIAADSGRTLTVNPVVTETTAGSGFTKTGGGSLIFTNTSNLSGLVDIQDGAVRVQTVTGVGTGPVQVRNLVSNASADNNDLQITGGLTWNNTLLMENGNNQNARTRLVSTNAVSNTANTWAGDITFRSSFSTPAGNQTLVADTAPLIISGDLLQDPTLPTPSIFIRGGNAGIPGTITGNILLGPAGGLFKTDGGTWSINSTGNTMGTVICADGLLVLNNNDALEPDSVVQMGQGSTTTGRMLINAGFTQQLAGITTPGGATPSTSPTGHSIFGPGTIDFGAVARSIDVPENTATLDELTIHAPISGSGGFVKNGAGNLIINGAVSGPVTVTAGGLGGSATIGGAVNVQAGAVIGGGTATSSATLSVGSLTLAAGTNIAANIGTTSAGGGDLIASAGAVTSGGAVISLTPNGSLTNGFLPLINYTGATPGLAGFSLSALPYGTLGSRASALLSDSGTAIGLDISGADKVYWSGASGAAWDVGTTANWNLQSSNVATTFQQMDALIFDDRGTNTSIVLDTAVSPVRAEFNNTTAVSYTVSGTGGFSSTPLPSPMVLDKTGTGTVTLATANAYTGATNVTNGLLIANHVPGAATAAITAIPTASVVNVSGPGTVRFAGDNTNATAVAVNVPHIIRGNGTVEHQPRATAGQTAAVASNFNGNNREFTGTLRLLSPASGTGRLTNVPFTALGSASVEVQAGHQFFTAAGHTYANPITIAGTGYQDANGFIGALRLENNSTWSGPITVDAGGGRIGAHNGSATVSGPVSGGPLEVNTSNYNNNYTVFFTGTNSYTTTAVGGVGGATPQNSGNVSMLLNIGAGGTTGTLGTGAVTIYGEQGGTTGSTSGVLRFDRADGYTLAAGNTIGIAGGTLSRTFLDLDCRGAGFANNGVTIDMGTPGSPGGNIRVGVTRPNAVASFTGSVKCITLTLGNATASPANGAILNLEDTASVAVTNLSVAGTGSNQVQGNADGAALNVKTGSSLNVLSQLYVGDANSSGGIYNQTGGDVTVGQQVRIGHWPNALSTATISGGTLTLTGESSLNTPSTAGGGGANATGDNNINALAANAIVGGGIYLGNDGTGVLNHSGGTITTNWLVLDNRGNSTAGGDGIDRYNISGSALLKLRSEWGLNARNVSTNVSLGGGTIQLDNTGTGGPAGNTGADLDVPLDAILNTVDVTTTTLDTNGADNSFILTRDVTGTGALDLTGGGSVELRSTGTQTISPILAGNVSLSKTGAGSTVLTGGSGSFTGATTVSEGSLSVNGALGGALGVMSGATLAGSGSAGAVTVQSGGIIAPGAGAGAAVLGAASADLQSGSRYDVDITAALTSDKLNVSGALTANGTIKVTLNGYVPVAGDSFDIADAASFSGTPTFDFTGAVLTAGLAWDTSSFLTTGTISVITDDPFTAWAQANSVTGGKSGDDDNDGATNLLEFATNANPKTNGSGARAYGKLHLLAGENVLTLTVAVRKNATFGASGSKQTATQDKVIYNVEASDDLVNWNTVVVSELSPADSAAVQASLPLPALDADWEWHSFRTDDSTALDPRDMIRLSVSAAP